MDRDSRDRTRDAGAASTARRASRADPYEPPAIIRLGTLAELTQGGTVSGEDDGFGFAGAEGSLT